jgi:hypothetical protein
LAGKEGFEPSVLEYQYAGFRIGTLRNFRKAIARKLLILLMPDLHPTHLAH